MPAIINAIYDAIGVRFNILPVTPEKVLKALQEKQIVPSPSLLPAETVSQYQRTNLIEKGRGGLVEKI